MSEQPAEYKSLLEFSFTLQSGELPIRTFIIWNAKKSCLRFLDDPEKILLMLDNETFDSATDLELSDFVLFLFCVLILAQFYGLKFECGISEPLAARLDRLPKLYSQLGLECFKVLKPVYHRLRS